jgi:hypothetical protein
MGRGVFHVGFIVIKCCTKRKLKPSGRTSHNFFDSLWVHEVVPSRILIPKELVEVVGVVIPRPQSPSMNMPATKKTGSHLRFKRGPISKLSRHGHELDEAAERKVEAREVNPMAFKIGRRQLAKRVHVMCKT